MNNNFMKVKNVSAIIIILLIIIGAFVYFAIRQSDKTGRLNEANRPLNSQTNENQYTLEKYHNTLWGYSLRYPDGPGEVVIDDRTDEKSSTLTINYTGVDPATRMNTIYPILIISNPTNEKSAQDYVNSLIDSSLKDKQSGLPYLRYQKRGSGFIGEIPYDFLYGVWASDVLDEHVYVVNEGKLYEFIFPIGEPNTNFLNPEYYNSLAWEILRTFQLE